MPTTPPHRLLWTGPSPSAMLDRLLASETIDPDTIWLVPSPLCRRRVLRALTLHSGACLNPRLWTWDDLWVQVRAHVHEDGPAVLSEVASREFLRAAIREARRDGHLDGLEALAETAGYRRQLRRAFSPWSWQHRSLAERPSDADPATWAVYERYRRLLQGHKVADHPLFEGWAVRRLSTAWTSMAGSSPVVVIAPPSTALERQALKAMIQRSASIHILMSWEDDADRHEVYLDLERMRKGCHAFGFEVETHNLCDDRPGGVLALQKSLFREPEPPLVEQTEGFHLL
ncbi:MAG TPA: hypothetical protein VFT74_20640, partial [Isosphaeraceae bacterium]|nr:hypothetical protein [Isosphaeraceae bacterium]